MAEIKQYRELNELPSYGINDTRDRGDIVVDTITVNETSTFTGVATFTAAPVFTAGPTGPVSVETKTASYTVTAADSGKTFLMGTDAQVFTLPSTAAGLTYTFINSGADGNNILTISPAAADGIHGTIILAAAIVELSGDDDKDLINTKVTATTGNSVTLVGDGVAGWFVVKSTGIWASES